MTINVYQWIVPAIGAFFIFRSLVHYRSGRHGVGVLISWIITSLGISVLAIFPDQISIPVANWLGIKDNVNAVIFIGLGALLVNNYFMRQKVDRLERQLNTMVRQYAKDTVRQAEKK